MSNADYIWTDPEGVWFRAATPGGVVMLIGPFADNAEGEEGADRLLTALVGSGWKAWPRI